MRSLAMLFAPLYAYCHKVCPRCKESYNAASPTDSYAHNNNMCPEA